MTDAVYILIFTLVSLFATITGSICGLGGGVVIKPILDSLGIMGVSSVSFLSTCTVLSMSVVSVFRNVKNKTAKLNVKVSLPLAAGAAVGGVLGKTLFSDIKESVGNEELVGLIQASVMLVVIVGVVIYTLLKSKIKTLHFSNAAVCVIVGLVLGIISSFLGIGCGPINLITLGFFFSMGTKDAALNSIFIIIFAQLASLIQTFVTGTVPDVSIWYVLFMVAGGIAGGFIGSKINKKISEENVTRLFLILMFLIIIINIYNIYEFGTAL
ncbi:MAG: sulfite exporter TauE/SafE family protein [Clostridiales bacterium]|nr:sulfite exporter TauE/SafE family protein [Clostridiales bacterium]